MKLLSCNIRYCGAPDGENAWENRKDLCLRILRERAPDVICFQELWARQFDDLSAALPEYGSWAILDHSWGPNPTNGIFYRRGRWRPAGTGGYWLSDTPQVPGSRSWGSDNVRLANWITLEDPSTGFSFRVVNTHLDHISQEARENQARVVVEEAALLGDFPQILTGDMNSDAPNRAIAVFKEGGWVDTDEAANGTAYAGHTYHAFLGEAYASAIGKMDWIFLRGPLRARSAEVIRDADGGRFPSDHYFLEAAIEPDPLRALAGG